MLFLWLLTPMLVWLCLTSVKNIIGCCFQHSSYIILMVQMILYIFSICSFDIWFRSAFDTGLICINLTENTGEALAETLPYHPIPGKTGSKNVRLGGDTVNTDMVDGLSMCYVVYRSFKFKPQWPLQHEGCPFSLQIHVLIKWHRQALPGRQVGYAALVSRKNVRQVGLPGDPDSSCYHTSKCWFLICHVYSSERTAGEPVSWYMCITSIWIDIYIYISWLITPNLILQLWPATPRPPAAEVPSERHMELWGILGRRLLKVAAAS